MADIIRHFKNLNGFYDTKFSSWEFIDDLYEEHEQKLLENPEHVCRVEKLDMVRNSIKDPLVLSTLMDICASINTIRKHSGSYDNTYDCWDRVIEVSSRDGYLSFIYALTGLVNLKPNSAAHIKLSIAAASTYFLSITIPGAKGFHIFEEKVIEHTLKVFNFIDKLQDPKLNNVLHNIPKQQQIQIWINFERFCDIFKLVFEMVQFDECKHLRNLILQKLIGFQFNNHELGYPNIYAANLHANIFGIFDSLIDKHYDDLDETILKIMQLTMCLHVYQPNPKKQNAFSFGQSEDVCEHISEWFVKMIGKYPSVLTSSLQFFIRCIITNPEKGLKAEQFQKTLDYAAKYDAALYSKCNESIIPFLERSVNAEDSSIRIRSINLLTRILLIESNVNWTVCGGLVSKIPREVYILKCILNGIIDENNSIKLHSVQALLQAFQKGNPNTIKILTESIQYSEFSNLNIELPYEPPVTKNEIRYGKPSSIEPNFTFKGHEVLENLFNELPENIYSLFASPLAYLRRAALLLLEIVVKLNPLIIFNTDFVRQTSKMKDETTPLVRKQALTIIDSILSHYPNCHPAIWVWCKLILPMLKDNDQKTIDLAVTCFKAKVLDNIESIENSNKAEHFMPWVIIRTLLCSQRRLYLQCILSKELKKYSISQPTLTKIAKQTLTSNSTEAWTILNFVAGIVKNKEPDFLIHSFTTLNSWNHEHNLLIIIEVLNSCIDQFSPSALNIAFIHIYEKLKNGSCLYTCVGRVFDLLVKIHHQSVTKFNTKEKEVPNRTEPDKWQLDLYQLITDELLKNMDSFPENRSTYLSYLYLYTEINVVLPYRPNGRIVSFAHSYLAQILTASEDDIDLENERIFNCMIQIAGRLAIRDRKYAENIVLLCGNILVEVDRPPIVNTILITLTDLAKKHTRSVENILSKILLKLNSKYLINRLETFKNLQKLILQDQLKLRGNILLSMLSILIDSNTSLSNRACVFFYDYMCRKNPTLFQKCLYECPYSLNEYVHSDIIESNAVETLKSPLSGEQNRNSRYKLYNQMINACEDVQMLVYFENLNKLYGKLQRDDTIKSAEGIAMIKDVFYILKRISNLQLTKLPKNTRDDENMDDIEDIEDMHETMPDEMKTSDSSNTSNKRKRQNGPTITEALEMIEKTICIFPKMSERLLDIDQSFGKYIDDLATTFCKSFTAIAETAQPASFWNKYRGSQEPKGVKRKAKDLNSFSESSDDNDNDIEDQQNLASASNRIRNCDDLFYEYVFFSD